MVACCIPCTLNKPAFRSRALNSFISRFAFRVQAADSNEHHAVLSVASAMIKAATGSTHLCFSCGCRADVAAGSDGVFTTIGLSSFRPHAEERFCSRQYRKMPWKGRTSECL